MIFICVDSFADLRKWSGAQIVYLSASIKNNKTTISGWIFEV